MKMDYMYLCGYVNFFEFVKLGSFWKCIVGCVIYCLKWFLFVVCLLNLIFGIWIVFWGFIFLNLGWVCLVVNF